MWQLENRTPFAADRAWVRDRQGAEVWLVAVKCTFDIRTDGSTEVSAEQPPVLRAPEYYGKPGKSSIKYESDLVLTKTTTDIIVVGHAHAPDDEPVTQLDVGFRVGPVQKMLRVFGDRTWGSFRPASPEPFVRLPLVYERAFGGADLRSPHPERDWDLRNPLGTGFATSREHLTGTALPNFEYRGELVASWKDRPRPAGFGAVAGHWQPRATFAGTYDERWMKQRQPLLPDDFDDRFYQCVPQDQQAPTFLRGGELVSVHGLTPDGDLRFMLPKVFLGYDTRFSDNSREIHKERRLHTVVLEPDYPRVSLVWHTALECHARVQKLERTIVTLRTELNKGELAAQSADLELV